MTSGLPHWAALVFGAVAAVGAITDYRAGKIHNWLTFPLLAFGFALAAVFGVGPFWSALKGVGLAAVLFLPLFFWGVLGGGDVKLILGLSTVLGARGTFELACASFVVAGAGALALLIRHRRVRVFLLELKKLLVSLVTPGLEIHWPRLSREIKAPFGIAIFVGFLSVVVGHG